MKPLFIALEGQDGSGKSTLTEGIREFFEDNKIPYVISREPGGTYVGEKIRSVLSDKNSDMNPYTEALLFAASRSEICEKIVRKNLKAGVSVILDRFLLSSLAYQGYARKIGYDEVLKINDFFLQGLRPDISFFIDIDVEKSYERINKKDKDRLEDLGIQFQKDVYDGYKKAMEKEPFNVIIIDGELSIQEMKKELKTKLEDLIKKEV